MEAGRLQGQSHFSPDDSMQIDRPKIKKTHSLFRMRIRRGWLSVLIFIVIMAVISEYAFSFHDFAQKTVLSIIGLYGVLLWQTAKKGSISRSMFGTAFDVFLPFGIALIYTVLIVTINNQYNLPIIPQAFTSTIFAAVQMFAAAAIAYKFKDRTADIVTYYILLSYSFTVIGALNENSLSEIVAQYNTIYNVLERHDVGVAVVPLILYYIYLIAYEKQREKKGRIYAKIFFLFATMVMSGKRAAYISIVVGIFVMYMVCWRIKNKARFIRVIATLSVIYLYGYILLIHSGLLIAICNALGIQTAGRINVWDHFKNQYSVSPLYFGKGFQYVHLYMMKGIADSGKRNTMVSLFGYLHNSDLQIFIELGFWGFFLWFIYYLYWLPGRVKKRFGVENYYLCVVMQISMVVMYMVDNVLTYPVYQTTIYAILFSHCLTHEKRAVESAMGG